MCTQKHHQAAADLDHVRDEHDARLGERICESADERRQRDVREHEKKLQHRRHPRRRLNVAQQRDRSDQKSVVGQ